MQRNLVGCLLAGGAFHQGNHPVEKRLAGVGGDADHNAVGKHLGAAGDRRAVPAALADDGRGFAGDGTLIDRGDSLGDLAVAGNELPRLHHHQSPFRKRGRGHLLLFAVHQPAGRACLSACGASASACALPRPSAMASAKLAKSTVNHSQRHVSPVNQSGAGPLRSKQVARPEEGGEHRAHLHHEHDGILCHQLGGQLAEALLHAPGRGWLGSKSDRDLALGEDI